MAARSLPRRSIGTFEIAEPMNRVDPTGEVTRPMPRVQDHDTSKLNRVYADLLPCCVSPPRFPVQRAVYGRYGVARLSCHVLYRHSFFTIHTIIQKNRTIPESIILLFVTCIEFYAFYLVSSLFRRSISFTTLTSHFSKKPYTAFTSSFVMPSRILIWQSS